MLPWYAAGGQLSSGPITTVLEAFTPTTTSGGYWRFEEGSANTIASGSPTILDASGAMNNGTPSGTPFYRSDVPVSVVPQTGSPNCLSINLDSPDDKIFFASQFVFNRPGDATLEFWLKYPGGSHQSVFWGRSDCEDSNRFSIYVNPDQTLGVAKGQRALAANAQYQIGVLYERLGHKADALRAFKVVVTQFADQMEWAKRAQERIGAAAPIRKAVPVSVVKADTSPANRQYLATFSALNGQYFSSPAIDSAVHRLYVVTQLTFEQVTIPVPGYPGGIAINPNTGKVYVDSQGFAGNDKLFVIDGDTNAVSEPIDLNGVTSCCVVVNPRTNRIYASTGSTMKTRVFNGADNSVLADLPAINVRAVDPATNRLYAESDDGATAQVIDGNTHNVIASFDCDLDIGNVAIDSAANRLYAVSKSKRQIVAIDTSTYTELGRMTPCEFPASLTLDDATGRFYVCSGDGPAVMVVLAKGALEGEIAEEFFEGFDSPTLDPAWTELRGIRNYSLAENSGHLRQHVIASSADKSRTILFRKFRGDSWTIETKVSYSMGTSGGGRSFGFRVDFGSVPPQRNPPVSAVDIVRGRDDWDNCCPGWLGVGLGENGTSKNYSLPLSPADTYYLRIQRSGETVTVEASKDEVNFTTIGSYTFGPQIKNVIQYLSIRSDTHSNNDAYADYDYVRLTKTPSDQH